MADSKITALTAISTVDPTADPLVIVDVSDTSMAASGTTKKSTINQLLGAGGTATLASATITGDLTVDTSTLKVDSANNRVTVGTLSAYGRLTVGVGSGLQAGTTTNVAAGLVDIDYATTGDINTRLSFVNSNGVTNAAIDRIGNPNFNNNGNLAFLTRAGAGSLTERYRIAADGVCTWSEVGGVAGTAMTLNSTGLGVGTSPNQKFVCAGPRSYFAGGGAVYGIGIGFNTTRTAADHVFFLGATDSATPDLVFSGASGAALMRLDASGNLLVGTTTPEAKLTVLAGASGQSAIFKQPAQNFWCVLAHNQATSGDNSFVMFGTESTFTFRGSITYNRAGGLISYNTTSDYRAKDIIGPVSNSGSLIDSLKVYVGKMKGATIERPMLIAHEAQEVAPYAVTGTKDEVDADGNPKYQQMDASALVPLLIAEIQSLRTRVQTLETR